jgi:hypothetical protein
VPNESVLTALAALAGDGTGHYSRRLRQGESGVRFPAYSAGRRLAEHRGNARYSRELSTLDQQLAITTDYRLPTGSLQPPNRQHIAPPRDTTGTAAQQILDPGRRLLEKPLVLAGFTENHIEHHAVARVRH